ncbi:MAG: D-alanine--D-alanine ligase [Elainellaceae cyanobacterium]
MVPLQVLHLIGSAQDEFHCELSRLFVSDGLDALARLEGYQFHIAYITPDRQWRFPASLAAADIAAATSMPLPEAIATIEAKAINVVLPHMFCVPGMTQYRSLFDLVGLPYIGNPPELMALTTQKHKAKAIVAAAGVKVPQGELLRRGETPTLQPPVVVKPDSTDNSFGITFVKDRADYPAALDNAFQHSEEVLVETFIAPGREVRCGVLQQGDALVGLPLEEYPVDASDRPIRNYADKLKRSESGNLTLTAKEKAKAWIVATDDPITPTVQAAAVQCHRALGCRHYSLFDFRIDSTGQPWFLEAGLYCSFSPKSVIPTMAAAAGIPLEALFTKMINTLNCNPT